VAPRPSWLVNSVRMLVCSLLVLFVTRLDADSSKDSQDPKLWAAFVFSLAKYIDWPDEKSAGPFILCTVNLRPDTQAAFEQYAKANQLRGKAIQITPLTATQVRASKPEGCHILYQEVGTELAFGSNLPSATVYIRDMTSTSNIPPTILLWVSRTRGGKVRFSIERASRETSSVKFSSQLLKLATPLGE
jgi:hypothetical protein